MMDKSKLQQTLTQVHSELADADSVDQDTRQLLTTLTNDIQRLLEKDEAPPAAEEDSDGPLSKQVRGLMLQFESEHPKLTSALNQVADGLANLGI
jgi:hypothetical protein